MKCNHDLAECECADLKERLESIVESPDIFIAPEYQERIAKRAEQNANEQTKQE